MTNIITAAAGIGAIGAVTTGVTGTGIVAMTIGVDATAIGTGAVMVIGTGTADVNGNAAIAEMMDAASHTSAF